MIVSVLSINYQAIIDQKDLFLGKFIYFLLTAELTEKETLKQSDY